MAIHLESVMKYNDVSGWRHTLGKVKVFFEAPSQAGSKEEASGVEWNDKTWEEEMKEKLSGGRWW